MDKLAAVILAAGQGTRMRSDLPKVLHRVLGRPLVGFSLELTAALECAPVVIVVGHGREAVTYAIDEASAGRMIHTAVQAEQRGTGHAVMCALPALEGYDGPVLVAAGDVPLLDLESVALLQKTYREAKAQVAFLTFRPADPTGYGRVLRDASGAVACIREQRDCSPKEGAIGEVNSGIYIFDAAFLRGAVARFEANNDQGELYLTDAVAFAAKEHRVASREVAAEIVLGINDRVDLARVEGLLAARVNERLMREGVTMLLPHTIRIELGVTVGADTELGPGVQLAGKTRIGSGCRLEAGVVVSDSTVADGAELKAYSVLEGAVVGPKAVVGPMARLRPGAVLGEAVHVGNFVELKKTTMGKGSKANHLAYLGDGEIGERVNVGAGTIFCNYDGFQKHKTVLCDEVFIGSDSQLVAPVTVGHGAYVGSGSTITKDVPADALAISRVKQENKLGVGRALRDRLRALKKRADEQKARAADEGLGRS